MVLNLAQTPDSKTTASYQAGQMYEGETHMLLLELCPARSARLEQLHVFPDSGLESSKGRRKCTRLPEGLNRIRGGAALCWSSCLAIPVNSLAERENLFKMRGLV